MIDHLNKNEVFVAGTNMLGHHLGGAAKQAYEHFGLQWGVWEGMSGQTYAFPSLDEYMEHRPEAHLRESVQFLREIALANPDKRFLLTKVGCGIAGYEESYMRGLFKDMPENVIKPSDWI